MRLFASLAGATISSSSPFLPEKLATDSARSIAPSDCLFRLAAVGVSCLPSNKPNTREPGEETLGAAKEIVLNPLQDENEPTTPSGRRARQAQPPTRKTPGGKTGRRQ